MRVMRTSYDFDAFLSYAMRADYGRARALEAFLEAIVQRARVRGIPVLRICRDGSDFRLPRRRDSPSAREAIARTIDEYLARSHYLLVLCSPQSVASEWVDYEIRSFIGARGSDDLLVAVTAGDPVAAPESVFPKALHEEGLTNGIWYDLRGRSVAGARDEEDERLRLAADLLDWDQSARGPLLALWQREELRRRRRQIVAAGVALVALIVLTATALFERQNALRRLADSTVTSLRLLTMNGRFNDAAALADTADVRDRRIVLAKWLIDQERSLPETELRPALGKDQIDDLTLDNSGALLIAVMFGERREANWLIAVDAKSGVIAGRLDLPQPSQIHAMAALPRRPREILVVTPNDLLLASFAGPPRATRLASLGGVRSAVIFAGGAAVLALRGNALTFYGVDGDHVSPPQTIQSGVTAEASLASSPDHTMIALVTPSKSDVSVANLVRLFTLEGSLLREWPLPRPITGRVVGSGFVAALSPDDSLEVFRVGDDNTGIVRRIGATRPIGFKPWLGYLGALDDVLLVQEVADVDLNLADKISFLVPTSGREAFAPSAVRELVAGSAYDRAAGLLYFASHDGRISRIDMNSPRARTLVFPDVWTADALQAPARAAGKELLIRSGNAIDGTLWSADPMAVRKHVVRPSGALAFDRRGDGALLMGTMEGLAVDCVSPSMLTPGWTGHIAVSPAGDRALVTGVETAMLVDLRNGAVLKRFANDTTIAPVLSFRWLSDSLAVVENYHGQAVLLDVMNGKYRVLKIASDAVTNISPRGECIIATLSGDVWRVATNGAVTRMARVVDLRSLFPLSGSIYVGLAEAPLRASFYRQTAEGLEEVSSLPLQQRDRLQDALVVDGKVVLVLSRSLVTLPVALPDP